MSQNQENDLRVAPPDVDPQVYSEAMMEGMRRASPEGSDLGCLLVPALWAMVAMGACIAQFAPRWATIPIVLAFVLLPILALSWVMGRKLPKYIRQSLRGRGIDVCGECGYPLRQLRAADQCPECGTAVRSMTRLGSAIETPGNTSMPPPISIGPDGEVQRPTSEKLAAPDPTESEQR